MKIIRKYLFFVYTLISFSFFAQVKKEDVLRRFQYLNFHSSLNNVVSIDDTGIKIYSSAANKKTGKAEFTLSWDDTECYLQLLKNKSADTLVKIYESKRKVGPCFIPGDALYNGPDDFVLPKDKKLYGRKIALDPGHIAGDLETGKIERKYLEFRANDTTKLKEEIKIVEGVLAWNTAMILKASLEKEGAKVFITRTKAEYTTFGISYDDWLLKRKKKVLDSLKTIKKITLTEYKKLIRADKEKFFLHFFKDYDLANRIKIINNFDPDLTVIIHYNVDEKNTDWLKPGPKNYSMCFVGGGMTADNFSKTIHKINFLRLLLTDDLDKSEKISGLTVQEFSRQLKIPIAKKSDAAYLAENCNETTTPGVYCRNLALCRGVMSPLVYGECLYQDNFEECQRLNKCDKEYFGIKTNERVKQVADCYNTAILNYFGN